MQRRQIGTGDFLERAFSDEFDEKRGVHTKDEIGIRLVLSGPIAIYTFI